MDDDDESPFVEDELDGPTDEDVVELDWLDPERLDDPPLVLLELPELPDWDDEPDILEDDPEVLEEEMLEEELLVEG